MQIPTHRRVADRYQLDTVLGRGGMGTVWRAQDELLGRPVAVKLIQPLTGYTQEGPSQHDARALREARAASRLNHRGAVTVYDIVQEGDQFSIVMELIEAPNLAELVQRDGPLPPARVAVIGTQLLDVLEFAHQAGIVHRDIKPANVMVLPGDQVKLTDFGIASLRGDPQLTSSGATIGSPRYMSPEQAAGHPAGPAADLWGLGATLYFAVEGRPPFQRPGTTELLAAILTQPPDAMQLAGPLRPTLSKVLIRNVDERPDAAQLRHLLTLAIRSDTTFLGSAQPGPAQPGPPPFGATQPVFTDPGATGQNSGSASFPVSPDAPARPAGDAPLFDPAPPTQAKDAAPHISRPPTQATGAAPHISRQAARALESVELPGTPAPTPTVAAPPQRRPPAGRAVVLLGGLSAVLAVAVVGLGIDVLHQNKQLTRQKAATANLSGAQLNPANNKAAVQSRPTSTLDSTNDQPTGTPDSAKNQPSDGTGNAGDAKAASDGALSPSSPDAPSTSLGLGASGHPGLHALSTSLTAPAGTTLAPGVSVATNQVGGYRVGVPPAFQVSASGPTTFVEWNDPYYRVALEVHSYRPVDPLARLKQDQALFAHEHADDNYQRTRLGLRWTYAGHPGYAWEFSWDLNGGKENAREVAFKVGARTYTVLYRTTPDNWGESGDVSFGNKFEQAFTALP